MSVDLLIGIVAYRSGDSLARCLDSLVNQDHQVDLTVSLVDNGPESSDAEWVESSFPEIVVTRASDNPGYGGGMNRAFSAHPSCHFLILNPDTQVEAGALQAMVRYLDRNPDVGAVGPRLIYPDGSPHPVARRYPTLGVAAMECLDLNVYFPDNSVLSEASYRGADPATLPSVDWLTGAALLVRSGLFRDLGGFDEAFFMYSEETDLQMRIHKSGYRIGVCPDAVFSHEHAHSTQRTDLRQVEFYKSLWYYFRKHHGRLHSSLIRLLLIIRSVAMGTIVLVRYSMDSQTRNHRLSPLFRLLAWSLRLAPRRQFRQTDIRHSPPSST